MCIKHNTYIVNQYTWNKMYKIYDTVNYTCKVIFVYKKIIKFLFILSWLKYYSVYLNHLCLLTCKWSLIIQCWLFFSVNSDVFHWILFQWLDSGCHSRKIGTFRTNFHLLFHPKLVFLLHKFLKNNNVEISKLYIRHAHENMFFRFHLL